MYYVFTIANDTFVAEEKKAAKEKRKRDKAKAIPISETPEETQAFLAAARGLSQPTGAGHQSVSGMQSYVSALCVEPSTIAPRFSYQCSGASNTTPAE